MTTAYSRPVGQQLLHDPQDKFMHDNKHGISMGELRAGEHGDSWQHAATSSLAL